MKKCFCFFLFSCFFFASLLQAEEVKKPCPARDFKYILNSAGTGVVIEEYVGKDTEVTIPATIKTFPVVKILSRNGGGYSGMLPDFVKKVNLPDSVKEIAYKAFYDCKNLKTVILGNGLEKIGKSAFYSSALESITIPDSVKEIGNSAFSSCKNLSDESKKNIRAAGYESYF